MKLTIGAVAVLLFPLFYYGQSITTMSTVYSDRDTYTDNGSSSTNYGGKDSIAIWVKNSTTYKRGYIHMTLPDIPSGAVIYSAKLRLTPYGTEGTVGSGDFTVSVSNTDWVESTLTAGGNTIASVFVTNVTANAFVSSKREFNVTDHVQALADARVSNFGWVIRRTNETSASAGKSKYYSRETGTQSNRPQLIIQYYVPAQVTAATIVHANTLTSTNGSVSPAVSYGSSATRTYKWYNSSGTLISSSQNLTGMGYGWYGLKSYGTNSGDTLYQGFIIGTQCEEVTISVPTGPKYMQDAVIYDLIKSGIDYSQSNLGAVDYFGASNWTNTNWYDMRSLMRFALWVDPGLTVNQANLTLHGDGHSNLSRTNESELLRVTSDWREYNVAHRNQPTTTATGKISLAMVANGNTNSVIDLRDFFEVWKTSNTGNYGFLIQLTSYTNSYTKRQYYSANAADSSNFPALSIKVAIPNCDLSTQGTTTTVANSTDGVDVTVNITPASWAVSPYNYFISESAIPEMTEWYDYLRDSVYGGTLDSTDFFGQGTASLSKTFGNQVDGRYYLAVFDAKGQRIYDNSAVYQFPVTLAGASGITLTGQNFKTAATSGYTSFDRYLSPFQGGAFVFTPTSSSNLQYYGITESGVTIASSHDIKHGIMISSSQISLISNYAIVGTASSYTTNAPIKMELNGKYLSYYVGENLKYTDSIIDSVYYKPAMWMAANTTTEVMSKALNRKPIVLHPLNLTAMTNLSDDRSCNHPDLAFKFKVTNFFGGTGSYSYTISPNAQIAGMIGPISSPITNTSLLGSPVTINSLPPGLYQMSVTVSGVTKVFYFTIGIQATWLESSLYNFTPTSYSVSAQNSNAARSITENVIPDYETNAQWFWFNPVFGIMPYVPHGLFKQYNKYKLFATLTNTYPSTNLTNSDVYFGFLRDGSNALNVMPYYHVADATVINLPSESYSGRRYFMMVQGIEWRLYSEYQGLFSTNYYSASRPEEHLRLETNTFGMTGGGFKNVYSTHCIPVATKDQVSHFEARRDLEAGFTFAYQNTLKFTFDEEYDVPSATDLEYILYDDSHNEKASYHPSSGASGGASALVYQFDDSRFELDLSPVSGMTYDQFYFVEIITAKGDRRFVRFQYKTSVNNDTAQPELPNE